MKISDRIKDEIKTNLQRYLEEQGIQIRRGRCQCPVHRGDSKTTAEINTRSGIVHGLPTLLHCPKCDKTWDVISLYAELNGMDAGRDFLQICQDLAERFWITLDDEIDTPVYTKKDVGVQVVDDAQYQALKAQAQTYLAECAQHLDDAAPYLAQRQISIETAKRCGLGYDNGYLIIPSGDGYNKRNTNPDCEHKDRYRKAKDLKAKGFGWDKLQSGAVCWVVEGELDALSLIEAGHIAAGLGGKDNVDSFCNDFELRPDFKTNPPRLILALDNDNEGKKAQVKLESWLKQKGSPYSILESWTDFASNEAKDANDALCSMGLDDFRQAANEYVSEFKDQKQRAAEKYRESSVKGRICQFWSDAQKADPPISTGFGDIDKILGGGLRPGLYVYGAIPSLGKTALVLQSANYMASRGVDVLYFSLEMPACDLFWRSISCLSYKLDSKTALSQRELQFTGWEKLGERGESALKAYDLYANTCASHVWIRDDIGELSVEDIEVAIANHKAMTGCAPVVVVDYLQILKPKDIHMTDKAALDYNALRLKQISNKYQTPMMIISSFNRASYSTEVTFESFKESGAIEYCADCLFGLQFKAAIDAKKDAKGKDADNAVKDAIKEAKSKETREIEFVVLKNRMGRLTGDRGLFMSFTPKFNHFESMDDYF